MRFPDSCGCDKCATGSLYRLTTISRSPSLSRSASARAETDVFLAEAPFAAYILERQIAHVAVGQVGVALRGEFDFLGRCSGKRQTAASKSLLK